MATTTNLMRFILSFEGGYVNDPADAGGATNKGVTIATFRQFFGKERTEADLRNITDAQWLEIFRSGYWNRWKADQISDQSIANTLVDWVWASGKYGITIPQRLLGVTADGVVGPKTLDALNAQEPKAFFEKLQEARRIYIDDIIANRPANGRFRKGWLRRINSIAYGSLTLNNGTVIEA